MYEKVKSDAVKAFSEFNKNADINDCWATINNIWPGQYRPKGRSGNLGIDVNKGESKNHNISISQKRGSSSYGIKNFSTTFPRLGPADLWILINYGTTQVSHENAVAFLNAMDISWDDNGVFSKPVYKTNFSSKSTAHDKNYAPSDKKGFVYYKRKALNELKNRENVLSLLKGLTRNNLSDNDLFSFANKYGIGYSEKTDKYIDRLVLFKYNPINEEAISHVLHNRKASKVAQSDGSFPAKDLEKSNGRPFVLGLTPEVMKSKVIILTEGVSDWANLASRGFATVTTGSSTTRLTDEILSFFHGKTLFIFPDADFAGLSIKWQTQINDYNKKIPEANIRVVTFWWCEWFKSETIGKKIVTNTLESWSILRKISPLKVKQNTLFVNFSGVNSTCSKYVKEYNLDEHVEFKINEIKNFKIVKKGNQVVSNGYDFTDFLNEESNEREVLMDYLQKVAGL